MSDQERLSGSRFLEEALGGETQVDDDAPRTVEPPRAPASGGLKPMIERKRKEIIDLEKKLEEHETHGTYTKKGTDGQSYFDYVSMQRDTTVLGRLRREYEELRERDREFATRATTQAGRAEQIAREYLNAELPKVPEAARTATGQNFAEIFKQMRDSGEWTKAVYADRAKVQVAIEQIYDAAFGRALRQTNSAPPGSSGLDASSDQRAKPDPNAGDDDFTSNLLYAHDRVKARGMTVAEAKRQALAAQKGSGQ